MYRFTLLFQKLLFLNALMPFGLYRFGYIAFFSNLSINAFIRGIFFRWQHKLKQRRIAVQNVIIVIKSRALLLTYISTTYLWIPFLFIALCAILGQTVSLSLRNI